MASPAMAPPDVRDVTLSLFAGLKTDIAPSDVPEGLSWDTQDGIYLPGDWQSRPGLAKLYASGALPAGTQVLYEKTYVQPNNDPLTLLLTDDGQLWVEDVGNTPDIVGAIGSVPQGLYAQSVSGFGREYIAFSDLLQGQAVPLQYDGANLDRVTMDGPGAGPTPSDLFPLAAIVSTSIGFLGPCTASETGNTVTVTTPSAHGFLPNSYVLIVGMSVPGYTGIWQILTVPTPTTFTYYNPTASLAAATGGAVSPPTVLAETTTPVSLIVGDPVSISGNDVGLNNNTAGNPATWPVTEIINPTSFFFSIAAIPQSVASGGVSGTAGGQLTIGGLSSPGIHQFVAIFLTRQGALTEPSPPIPFTSLGGGKYQLEDLPIGPSNVVARLIGATGAGGDNFFVIPATPQVAGVVVGTSTLIPDNTSSSWGLDFADTTLFAGVPIDQIGNDLFDQVVLGPVLGFFSYASRLSCWGDYNKIENFLNMGFCGGYLTGVLTTPLGWTVVTAGGLLVNGGSWAGGMTWQITDDGSGTPRGEISQPAYQDVFGDAIISPNTSYLARVWLNLPNGAVGEVVVKLSSVSTGFTSQASFNLGTATNGMQPPAAFSMETPAVIPSDLILSVYEFASDNGTVLEVGEIELIYAEDPYRDESRWSYAINPEGFAQTTGNLGAEDDASPIRCMALLRQSFLLETAEGVHISEDNTSEPYQWNVNQLTRAVGAVSLRAGDPGKFGTGDAAEDWAVIAGKNGVYLFAGSEFWKVSQEISRGALTQAQDPRITWDDTNWSSQKTIVAKNDPAARRAYFAVPINGAARPNFVWVLDYREMDTATQIAAAPPLHITIQGKMKSSDLTRKWSGWNIPANDIDILIRPGNQQQLFFAGGVTSANTYSLNPSKLTDDDYGRIGGTAGPYYTTYFFTDHDQEQALGIGSDMHLLKHIHAFIAGVGLVTITPIVDSQYNFQPNLSQRQLVSDTNVSNFLKSDLEWSIAGLRGQRIAFRIGVQPLPGTTDVQIRLQKFIVGLMKDPIAQFRQSGI